MVQLIKLRENVLHLHEKSFNKEKNLKSFFSQYSILVAVSNTGRRSPQKQFYWKKIFLIRLKIVLANLKEFTYLFLRENSSWSSPICTNRKRKPQRSIPNAHIRYKRSQFSGFVYKNRQNLTFLWQIFLAFARSWSKIIAK